MKKRANDIVRAHHAPTVSRVNRRNSALTDALSPTPDVVVGAWAWVCTSASTIRRGLKANTDGKELKATLALNWTDRYKILAIDLCYAAKTPDGSPLGATSSIWTLVGVWRLTGASPAPTPTTAGRCVNTYRGGWRSMCSKPFLRNYLRTTSLKTTLKRFPDDWRWSRSPAISRSRARVA